MPNLPQGWGFPLNSRKAHYFLAGQIISICNKMMYGGEREDDKHDHADNCAQCKRLHGKLAGAAQQSALRTGGESEHG
jgi:hypothetical protein